MSGFDENMVIRVSKSWNRNVYECVVGALHVGIKMLFLFIQDVNKSYFFYIARIFKLIGDFRFDRFL